MSDTQTLTISQRMAAEAWKQVKEQHGKNGFDEYTTFAKKFPSLVHSCGLAQAVAFAEAKKETDYLDGLAAVLKAASAGVANREELARRSRETPLGEYLRLSRNTLLAAGWLKRFVEAKASKD